MTLRANISPNYLMRLGLVGLFCLAGSLWFLYDGLVTYPNQRVRAEEFQKFEEEYAHLDELDRLNKWNEEVATPRDWPTGDPGEPKKDYDINEQFFYSGAAGLAALGFLSRLAYMFGRWIECDDTHLRDKAGHETNYNDITELNKKKWQSKGIAFVNYKANGGPGRIRIDDFYFDRETTRQILRKVEANIDHSLITNGKPEPPEIPAEAAPTEAAAADESRQA